MSDSSQSPQFPCALERSGWITRMKREIANENRERLATALLGIFADAKFFNAPRVQNYVDTYWNLQRNVQVERKEGVFFFFFQNLDDNGPFNVNGVLLLQERWTTSLMLQDFNITHVNLWVQIHKIPVKYFNEQNIKNVIQVRRRNYCI
ncbi:hypothetical protein LIER_40741 [Lithospermum erythrorhizon]|uniref:DUF4283 domain-containing protein n=1 Tax=Lithospermum erythrorhizon TaxID=34254 RepID=A0AAV3QYY4_LITER